MALKFVLMAGLLLSLPIPASAKELRGYASVTDGDTLKIGGQSIRLFGIDAPESRQKCTRNNGVQWNCGRAASSELDKHIGSRAVVCQGKRKDRYQRLVADCTAVGDPNTLSHWMVANGWAFAYTTYSKLYRPAEAEARASKVGIWSGTVVAPSEWRRRRRN